MLAGLLKAPSYFRADQQPGALAATGRTVIIGLMEEQGYLTAAEADEARGQSGATVRGGRRPGPAATLPTG